MVKMMRAVVAVSLFAAPVSAQVVAPPAVPPATPMPVSNAVVPANTEILLRMDEELTTRGGKLAVGTSFGLSLVDDVRIGNFIVIPRGTPAVGEVVWKTGKAAFGKSGKMEIAIHYLDLNGRHIPLRGNYRQEGDGNTMATVAVVAGAGVFGGLVTGKSATIPKDRTLKAYIAEPLAVILPVPAPISQPVAPAPSPLAN